MNTEKMTVHRALAELKTIDARIGKLIRETSFCVANKRSNNKIGGLSIEEYSNNVKANYTSIRSLMNRRNAMKKAVVLSNAITEIEIHGAKYRVAEAIEMKNHGMDNYRLLYNTITAQEANANKVIDNYNGEQLQLKADNYVQGLYGTKEKVVSAEAEATRKAYIDANAFDMIDPLGVNKLNSELYEYIDNFMAEIDSALSVSNAITEIEFSYET